MRGLRVDLLLINATRNFSKVVTQGAGSVAANQQLQGLHQTRLYLSMPLPRIMLYACRYVNCAIIANQSVACDTNPVVQQGCIGGRPATAAPLAMSGCKLALLCRRGGGSGRVRISPDISAVCCRSRLVFDRLRDFLPDRTSKCRGAHGWARAARSARHRLIPLSQKIPQPIKSLSDLRQQR